MAVMGRDENRNVQDGYGGGPITPKFRVLSDWLESGMNHVWLPYSQLITASPPIAVTRTEGSRIFLAEGGDLVDGIASWWTACHGYNHPHIREAVESQLSVMPHVMFGGLVHEPALTLARRLAELLPGDLSHVFFSESGSVAVEVALKMAAQFWLNRGVTGRSGFLAFRGGYHGDTAGAMAVTDAMHGSLRRAWPDHHIVDLPDTEETARAFWHTLERHAGELAAIIVEPL